MRSRARIGRFLEELEEARGLRFDDYDALWHWSVEEPATFWASVRDHFELWEDRTGPTLPEIVMPNARWFPQQQLSYPERALRLPGRADDDEVLVGRSQTRSPVALTARGLRQQVARVRRGLQQLGVARGSRVAAYMPNIPETVIAMLATTSLGAVWSSCSPEFGSAGVLDRFKQLEPAVLLAIDGYRHGSRAIARLDEVERIRAGLPSLRATVLLPYLDEAAALRGDALSWAQLTSEDAPLEFERVSFDHPLYVLYSSGTTGVPKAIVHGHGGMLIEHAKALGLHTDLGPSDRFLWHTTTGWMMWNYLVSGLIVGSTVLLVDGDPAWPDLSALWSHAAETRATYLGLGAPFIMASRRAELTPRESFDLSALRGLGSTGAPLPREGFEWAAAAVGENVPVGSLSGGTDMCTGFLGPSPLVPVWAGEISCRMLGVKAESWSPTGDALIGEQGELIVTVPLPSMPVGLLGDVDGRRYRETWFETFPGVWRHGDWVTITERGSCIISGRSDATLNRGGIRVGTAELYAVLEDVPGIEDALVVHIEDPGGGPGELIAFVATADGRDPDPALCALAIAAVRTHLSPRHAPDTFVGLKAVPRTRSGKKIEVPVKRILTGADPTQVVQAGSLADPSALDDVIRYAASRSNREAAPTPHA